jgi:hypothetical protein
MGKRTKRRRDSFRRGSSPVRNVKQYSEKQEEILTLRKINLTNEPLAKFIERRLVSFGNGVRRLRLSFIVD